MQARKEAQALVPLLTTDECRELLEKSLPPLTEAAGKSYRAVHQALADASKDDESKERADIFREELQLYLEKKSFILLAKKLIADDSKISRDMISDIVANGSREEATEIEKMYATILRDELKPSRELYEDALVFIGSCLKPSEAALLALDKQTALKHIKKEDSLSEQEKQLASQAKAALRDQSHFAATSRLLRAKMQFNLERLLETLRHHVKRGNLTLVRNVLQSFHDEETLSLLLTSSFTIDAYPGRELTLMQLAYVEKNGRMCQVLKEAFKQLPNGIEIMLAQLDEPFTKSRSQEETPYDFTTLVTAITTNTNVEAELVKFREDLAVIIAERGFPLTILTQITDIYIASWDNNRPWTDDQYDILFLRVFGLDGGAQSVAPDWLMRAFAAGIVNKDKVPGAAGDRPFVLQYPSDTSIDPVLLDPSSIVSHRYFVNLYGTLALPVVPCLHFAFGGSLARLEAFIRTDATELDGLTQREREQNTTEKELVAPPPRIPS